VTRAPLTERGRETVPHCLADVELLAMSRLPAAIWDFVAGGSGGETTLTGNRAALRDLAVVPRVLSAIEHSDTAATMLDTPSALPVAVAPMAYQRLVHPDGEPALARAARRAGVPYVACTLSSCPIEEIAAVGADTWFQLYWLRDRAKTAELIRRAEDSGCRALMVTVDVPAMGRRLRDLRGDFTLPPSVFAANFTPGGVSVAHRRQAGRSALAAHTELTFDPAFGWRQLDWVLSRTRLPVVLKGVLDERDAAAAAERGIRALVVSNHGGRQFDGAVPSITALPAVVEAVAGRCEVLMDSGIRDGTDVVRALALGATGVLLGRPLLWGLAYDGERGADRVLDLLRTELRQALLLAGCADPTAARQLRVVRRSAPVGGWSIFQESEVHP
jgi:4-hydroxymandelate oxidase